MKNSNNLPILNDLLTLTLIPIKETQLKQELQIEETVLNEILDHDHDQTERIDDQAVEEEVLNHLSEYLKSSMDEEFPLNHETDSKRR